jgi:mRNA-degrading endonuclease YafQ of YafQ-DinJ toxin-antitoxin module
MLAISSTRFDRDYKKLDRLLQHRVNKAIDILVGDPTRPGLRIERVKGSNEAWSCRVKKSVRIIYRLLDSDRLQLLLVGKHDAAYREGVFYWLAAPAVEEKIPGAELESFQMFTPSMNGIEEHLNEVEQLVREAEISDNAPDIAGLLRHLISATLGDGTDGKARVRDQQDVSGAINMIPSEHEGECREAVIESRAYSCDTAPG